MCVTGPQGNIVLHGNKGDYSICKWNLKTIGAHCLEDDAGAFPVVVVVSWLFKGIKGFKIIINK